MEISEILKLSKKAGAETSKIISVSDIVVAEWVLRKCQYGCSEYNQRLTCPPYSPTPSQMEKTLQSYNKAILLKHSNDVRLKEIISILEKKIFIAGYYKVFGLGAGPCYLCEKCLTPCRFPEQARPSMEACGIDVFQTVKNAGFELKVVKSYKDKPVYFGLVLIE